MNGLLLFRDLHPDAPFPSCEPALPRLHQCEQRQATDESMKQGGTSNSLPVARWLRCPRFIDAQLLMIASRPYSS